MNTAAGSTGLDLSHRAKVYVAVCFILSTLATAGINGFTTFHFGVVQAEQTTRKADVRKFEDQVAEFDQLIRLYMMGLNKGEPSDTRREAIAQNAQSQYDFLRTLLPLLKPEGRLEVEAYRSRLVEISKNLRASVDVPSTQPFAQSVAYAIDEREIAEQALRVSVGLPVGRANEQ